MKEANLPTSYCPVCGYLLDAATGVNHDEQPAEGDFSVCLKCGEVLRYNATLQLETPTLHDLLEIQGDRSAWVALEKAQRLVRKARMVP